MALSGYRPGRIITNEEAGLLAGVSAEWVLRRTGIQTRRYSDQGVLDLATAASLTVLQAAGLQPCDVDFLIAVTESSHVQSPPHAPQIADNLGIIGAGAFDLVAACAGFSYGLGMAAGLVADGSAHTVLVVAAEQMSIWVDPSDADTTAIFGDGAGAAIVTGGAERSVWPTASASDGGSRDLIGTTPASWLHAFAEEKWPAVRMDGPRVYRWVISNGPKIVVDALARAGLQTSDVDVFVPHQANLRISTELQKRAGLGRAVLARDIEVMGNTSSASIPLAATALLASGEALPGQTALFFGFGAGMTAAAQVVKLPAAFSLLSDPSNEAAPARENTSLSLA